MRREIVLPPQWQTAPVACPRCKAPAQARYNPNNGALEALRCSRCPWTQDYVIEARHRAARLAAARRKYPSSKDRQSRLNVKGDLTHEH